MTVVVPPATTAPPPAPSAAEIWHAEHEARHAEHMSHLETIREEHRSEISALNERVSACEAAVALLAATEPGEPVEGRALEAALETVERVGETIAEVQSAITPEPIIEEPSTPSHESHTGPTGPVGEVEPDTGGEGEQNAPPANRRRSRFW